jgi:hypothetical protein
MPSKRWGCYKPLAMAVTEIDELLVANTHCSLTKPAFGGKRHDGRQPALRAGH